MQKLKGLTARAVLLFEDETFMRSLPQLQRAWSLRGAEAQVPITGENAKKRSLWRPCLDLRTGRRFVAHGPSLRQAYFQGFLRRLS